jgi:rhamnulokinase
MARGNAVEGGTHCLALDCGASNIRLIDVALADDTLGWTELARFENAPLSDGNRQIWDYEAIYRHLATALRNAGASEMRYAAIGADSWGVDYVLVDERGTLLGPAVSYRDSRTNGQIEHYTRQHMSAKDIFAATGVQCLHFNTLYQLHAQSQNESAVLRRAHHLLFTADYAHYWLSGVARNERTLASTSQMLATNGHWLADLLDSVGLQRCALSHPIPPGTVLGTIRPELAHETGLGDVQVIAPAAHDTQSAVLCIPATGDQDWSYISSGTWSIIGVESPYPILSADAERSGLSNESGYGGTFCVQSTVVGLWLIQEIQRLLGDENIAGLAARAELAMPFRSIVNPADPRFFNPADMIAEIRTACREVGEPVPETPEQLARCAYDGLALLYRATLLRLSAVTERRLTRLHVVGGGAKAALLNSLCAAATGLPVLAGPAEATAVGNALAQFIALGRIENVEAGRRIISKSLAPVLFEPRAIPELDDAIARFERLTAGQEL